MSSCLICFASSKHKLALSCILLFLIFLNIKSSAHLKFTAVGLVFIKASIDLSIFLEDASFLRAKASPNAAVTPIRGAPLTSMCVIALQNSLNVFSSLIFNSNGNFV